MTNTNETRITASGRTPPRDGYHEGVWFVILKRGSLVQRREFHDEGAFEAFLTDPSFNASAFANPSAGTKKGRALLETRERRQS